MARATAIVVANSRLSRDIESRQWYERDVEILRRLGFETRLARDARDLAPADVYLSWWVARSAPVVALARLLRRRSVVVAGGTDSIRNCPALPAHPFFYDGKPAAVQALTRFALGKADAVVAVSGATVPDLEALGARRIHLMHNCVDTELFHPGAGERRPGPPELVTVCNMDKDACVLKGLVTVLEAFALVRAQMKQARLTVIGAKNNGFAGIVAQLDRLGIREHVAFAGQLPNSEVAAWFRRSALFLTATRYETFGVAAAEAMACGLPVVGPRLPALVEMTGGGEGLVEVGEPDILAAKALEILRQPDVYRALSERGRARIAAEFNVEKRARCMAKLLDGLGCPVSWN